MRLAILVALASAAVLAQVRVQPMEDASKENLPSQKLGIDRDGPGAIADEPGIGVGWGT